MVESLTNFPFSHGTTLKLFSVSCRFPGPFAKDIWSGPDDAFYILDRDAERVIQVRSGEAEVEPSQKSNPGDLSTCNRPPPKMQLESYNNTTNIFEACENAYRVARLRTSIHNTQVVSKGTIRLERPCGVAVEGPDRAVYVLDREGSRVVRYVRGRSMQVAGGTEPGSGAGQLNAGPTGRIYVPQI